MTFTGFTEQDFDVMTIPGLEPRMEALIQHVRPKLNELGKVLSPYLSALCGEEMFPHVAKHARRKVNPPNDTWVAWASSKRGYKALPHFQVGMFSTHLFIIFAVIYESPNKVTFAHSLEQNINKVKKTVPDNFYWSLDHMQPGGTLHAELEDQDFKEMSVKLATVKKSEILCGLQIHRDDELLRDGEKLVQKIEQTFETLLPLYKMAF
ncbi:DUF1054 domain-containing protein [Paenibacillus sediminis]|uniref:UPF0637 protein J2Z20_000386 n=1 Tax=Paenibacillus sediminis TaxID=664909 RepID=A0ABS4GZ33_9BACL|nr:DUF1054 domain-containing protein [Paenibacillus sediminis]MBP1935525.1 uncharacterized protein YktB (UPF0637 family) [Paenibacillus sediminis]